MAAFCSKSRSLWGDEAKGIILWISISGIKLSNYCKKLFAAFAESSTIQTLPDIIHCSMSDVMRVSFTYLFILVIVFWAQTQLSVEIKTTNTKETNYI